MPQKQIADLPAYFENHIERIPEAGCWIWTGTLERNDSYGHIPFVTHSIGAHRYSWMLHRGPIPDGMWVLHRCDVRSCVNPGHLFLGTHRDNTDDMLQKRNHFKSDGTTRRPLAKLDADQIRLIRTDNRTQCEIAKDHGVSQVMVSRIKLRKAYRFVTDNQNLATTSSPPYR